MPKAFQGLGFISGTNAERLAHTVGVAEAGTQWFETDTSAIYVWSGSAWFRSIYSGLTPAGGGLTGTYPNPTVSTVPQLAMPSGSVVKVEYFQTTTQVNITSTTIPPSTLIGLTGTIVPISTSSRILVQLALQIRTIGTGSGAGIRVLRNTAVAVGSTDNQNYAMGYTNAANTPSGRYIWQGIDSPATTSALQYTVYGSSYSPTGVDFQDDGQYASTMLLWEIR